MNAQHICTNKDASGYTKDENAFCPICGKRVIDNIFIGSSIGALRQEIEFAENDVRHADSSLRAVEEKHKKEIEPLRTRKSEAIRKVEDMREAMAYAESHGL